MEKAWVSEPADLVPNPGSAVQTGLEGVCVSPSHSESVSATVENGYSHPHTGVLGEIEINLILPSWWTTTVRFPRFLLL